MNLNSFFFKLTRLTLALPFLGLGSMSAFGLSLGVNVGVSTRDVASDVVARYKPLADAMGKAVREPVVVVPIASNVIRASLADKKGPDLMLLHPHHGFEVAEKNGYRLVAWTKDASNRQVHFLATAASGIHALSDIRGKTLGVTGRDSYATAMAQAELRLASIDYDKLQKYYTDHQDVAIFMLESGFAPVVTTRNDQVAAAWKAKGNPVISSAVTSPVYTLWARREMNPQLVLASMEYFRGAHLDSESWAPLSKASITSFDVPEKHGVDQLRTWLIGSSK